MATLGFDIKTDSATLDAVSIKEGLLYGSYTVSGTTLTITQNVGAVEGDCLLITDRTNSDYCKLDGAPTGGGTVLSFSSTAITNNYTAGVTKVQLLREQDPDSGPTPWFEDVDKIIRHGVKRMINEIDFSE